MANVDLLALVKDKVKTLKPYHVENVDCPVKLHANENSFPLPSNIQKLFEESFCSFDLNRYPDPDSTTLRKTLSQRLNVSTESLVLGNGSDELIQIILQIFCDMGDTVAFPDPTFAMYSILAKGMGLNTHTIPLDEQWNFKAKDLLSSIQNNKPKIIFFSYPNNPTGNCFTQKEIQLVIENFSGIVVVDEAYFDFSKTTYLKKMTNHNNVIILRSLSKIGLAGLRVGFAIADPIIINEINKVRLPYNSNTVSQSLAEQLLKNFEPIQEQIDTILQERDRVKKSLSQFSSLTVFTSDANFILFRTTNNSTELFNQLAERGILIRDLSSHPRLNNCLRVTVGTPEENDAFLEKIKEIIN